MSRSSRASAPPSPLLYPSQVGVGFRGYHPRSSQIGAGLVHWALIGVGLSGESSGNPPGLAGFLRIASCKLLDARFFQRPCARLRCCNLASCWREFNGEVVHLDNASLQRCSFSNTCCLSLFSLRENPFQLGNDSCLDWRFIGISRPVNLTLYSGVHTLGMSDEGQ